MRYQAEHFSLDDIYTNRTSRENGIADEDWLKAAVLWGANTGQQPGDDYLGQVYLAGGKEVVDVEITTLEGSLIMTARRSDSPEAIGSATLYLK